MESTGGYRSVAGHDEIDLIRLDYQKAIQEAERQFRTNGGTEWWQCDDIHTLFQIHWSTFERHLESRIRRSPRLGGRTLKHRVGICITTTYTVMDTLTARCKAKQCNYNFELPTALFRTAMAAASEHATRMRYIRDDITEPAREGQPQV